MPEPTVAPITPDYLRQLRILLDDGVTGYSRDAVASLVAEIDRLNAVLDRVCNHAFPPPDESTGEPEPGDCISCGMTYQQYDARHGERMAEALEGGA